MKNNPKHIVILVQNLPVPFDRRVWMESLSLRDAGYRVSVISPCPPDDTDRPIREIDGIHVYRYPAPPEAEKKASFLVEYLYSFWHTWRMLRRVWKDCRFDAIQTCNPPDIFWPLGRLYKLRGVKYVFDHHDLCPELFVSKFGKAKGPLYRALCLTERLQYATADRVICTNRSYQDVALKRGRKKPEHVEVVRSGPRPERFVRTEPQPALRKGKAHLCVYLGVMGAQDGVDYALRAVRHALDDGLKDTHFAFIGNGPEFDALIKLREVLGLKEHVDFTGRISNDDLLGYLSTADLGLVPDPKNPLNDVSSMNKVVEYMAMGVPVLGFDLKETRFTAQDAGVYVEPNDEKQMADCIRELIADPARRRQLGERGAARFRSGLDWNTQKARLIGVYEGLIGPSEAVESEAVVLPPASILSRRKTAVPNPVTASAMVQSPPVIKKSMPRRTSSRPPALPRAGVSQSAAIQK